MDFEYVDFVRQLATVYRVILICKSGYDGRLLKLGLVVHFITSHSKLDLKALTSIRHIVKDEQVDVVYCQNNRWLTLAVFSSYFLPHKPAIFCRRGICKGVSKFKLDDLLTYFNRRLSGVITISDAAKKAMLNVGYDSAKVVSVRPGINPDDFPLRVSSQSFRERFAINKEALLVMTVANERPVKGLDRLFKVAQSLVGENVHFCVIGRGCDRALLDKYNLEDSGNVTFLGYQERAYQYLSAADIYVQPSREEGLSYSLAQAILQGCCPVVTDVGGMVELVEHKVNGLVVSNDEALVVKQIRASIFELMVSQTQRQQFAIKGAEMLSQRFNAQRMAEATSAFFEQSMEFNRLNEVAASRDIRDMVF
ncbi:MAG: glycosyltransferase family 4 protein [Pseudomonadales bacterium]